MAVTHLNESPSLQFKSSFIPVKRTPVKQGSMTAFDLKHPFVVSSDVDLSKVHNIKIGYQFILFPVSIIYKFFIMNDH